MKNIAVFINSNSPRLEYLKGILSKEYNLMEAYSYDDVFALLEKSFNDIAAFIIDNPSSKEGIQNILSYVENRNSFLFTLPIIILSDRENMEKDDKYLSGIVASIIIEGDSKNIVVNRIENCIKFSSSASFDDFSNMLKVLPSLIYLKDTDGRYAFCSQNWHHLTNPNESIRGKTDFDIRKDKENARKAQEADQEVIKSGKGQSYVIKEEDDEGLDYLKIIKEPLKNSKGEVTGIIAIINNVTDDELLNQELRHKSITDQLTGLYNRAYFEEITQQDNNFDTPLTVISADCDGLKKINDRFGHAAGDKYICYARSAIKESLPKDSYIFRMGGDEFLAIIPHVGKEEAEVLVNKILVNAKKYKNNEFALRISVGSYTINRSKTTIDSAMVLSDKAMYKMKKNKKHK